jgi:copper chaperone CopZ
MPYQSTSTFSFELCEIIGLSCKDCVQNPETFLPLVEGQLRDIELTSPIVSVPVSFRARELFFGSVSAVSGKLN